MCPNTQPILIVEEDVALRERLYDLFTAHLLPVLTVHSGEHAIKALKHQLPSVVITDAALPDMTGRQLAHQIRQVNASLPVIVLGAGKANGHDASDVQACLPAAADVTDEALLKEVE
jgi:CheY-like chemotaxis protein